MTNFLISHAYLEVCETVHQCLHLVHHVSDFLAFILLQLFTDLVLPS